MATIKSYTDLEQSKKLAEILPLESTDMHYHYDFDFDELESIPTITEEDDHFELFPEDVRCWSLAALLVTLPFSVLYMEMVGGMILWCCECHFMETDEVIKIEHYDNPVDACYEMILKLNELNLL